MAEPSLPNGNETDDLGPLESDLEHLEEMAENRALPTAQRQEALGKAELLRWGMRAIPQLVEEAKQLGIDIWCREFDDDLIAELVAEILEKEDPNDTVLAAALNEIISPYQSSLPHSELQSFFGWLFRLLSTALCDEIERRRELNESARGRAIRELLVEEADRGEILQKLARRAAWKLHWPKQEKAEGIAEVRSIAAVDIWKWVAPLTARGESMPKARFVKEKDCAEVKE